jgi:hypothetical protein
VALDRWSCAGVAAAAAAINVAAIVSATVTAEATADKEEASCYRVLLG